MSDLIAGSWQVSLTEQTLLSSLIAHAASRQSHPRTSGLEGSNDVSRFIIDLDMLWVDLVSEFEEVTLVPVEYLFRKLSDFCWRVEHLSLHLSSQHRIRSKGFRVIMIGQVVHVLLEVIGDFVFHDFPGKSKGFCSAPKILSLLLGPLVNDPAFEIACSHGEQVEHVIFRLDIQEHIGNWARDLVPLDNGRMSFNLVCHLSLLLSRTVQERDLLEVFLIVFIWLHCQLCHHLFTSMTDDQFSLEAMAITKDQLRNEMSVDWLESSQHCHRLALVLEMRILAAQFPGLDVADYAVHSLAVVGPALLHVGYGHRVKIMPYDEPPSFSRVMNFLEELGPHVDPLSVAHVLPDVVPQVGLELRQSLWHVFVRIEAELGNQEVLSIGQQIQVGELVSSLVRDSVPLYVVSFHTFLLEFSYGHS